MEMINQIGETRRKAGEKMFQLIRQEERDSDQEDCLRSDSNTPDESCNESLLTDAQIVNTKFEISLKLGSKLKYLNIDQLLLS